MKAEMDSHGVLVIAPENGLEDYALAKWFEDWSAHKSVLRIRTTSETIPGGWHSHKVEPEPTGDSAS